MNTAVEWLVKQLPLGVKGAILDKIEQAKEMEEEEKKNNQSKSSEPYLH